MRTTAVCIGLALVALPLAAQTQSSIDPERLQPALTRDLTVSSTDSALVQAAKKTVLYRRAVVAAGPVWHIDDSMVGHPLRLAGASASTGVPQEPVNYSAQTFSSEHGVSPEQLSQTKQNLKTELARMVEEHDQPYAGDVPEDQVDQRLSTLPTQINAVDRQMKPPPSEQPPY